MVIFCENDRGKEGVRGRRTQLIIVRGQFRGNSAEFPLDIRRCHNCVTTDDVKAWLRRYADLLREADLLRARADAIRSRAASPPTSAVDGMPRGPSFEGDRIGGVISTADVIEGQVAEKEAQAAEAYREIDATIQQISGKHAAERKFILQCRYLDRMDWPDVIFLLFGEKDDFGDREDSYGRRAYDIHKAALQDIGTILDENKGEKEDG